ncbi:MAG: NADH-quinone oxidoreductase subunit C [Bacteriovoracaceae bacterium]|nr:NADH-quinone oxidoreductase subunit C [Bacteriovoracaceae bacterium]
MVKEIQNKANEILQNTFASERKFSLDKVGEPILWANGPKDALHLIKKFQDHIDLKIDFLSDLTAYDNTDKKDGEGRFVVVIQLLSMQTFIRIRLKVLLKANEEMETLTNIWPAANWLEREVFDMYGIIFAGHPNLKRILMDERFHGHPLRKEYPYKQREPFSDNTKINLSNSTRGSSSHE